MLTDALKAGNTTVYERYSHP